MNSYREKYLSTLTDTVCKIMGKPELSQQDIQLIMLYKSELRRVEYIPTLKRIMNGAKDVLSFIKSINPQDENETPAIGAVDTNSEITITESIDNADTV